jgi:hypothetical protein
VFRSPGLELVIGRLTSAEHPEVLDLGAPRRANLEFLADTGCKVWIEDLPGCLVGRTPPKVEDEPPDWAGLIASNLVFSRDARFDVVLGWDLLAYLDPQAIDPLMSTIAESCTVGTLLFLTVSTAQGLPERPGIVQVSDDGHLVFESSGPATRANPTHTPLALERMMPGFRLQHSFLLGEGMQDYLFSFQGR